MRPGKSRLWWRRKFTCYIVLLAMLFSMVGAVNPTPVYADSGTESDAATSLTIKVGTASSSNPTTVYTTLRTFSDEEMTVRATTYGMYSYFDSMPTPVMDAATGVPLSSLLNEVGIDLNDVDKFYFYTTDITTGPYKSLTKNTLYNTPRYYFPLIGDSWDADESKPAASGTWGDDPTAGKVVVEPMLAVSDNWKRVLSAGVPDFNTQDTSTRYRLMSGQSEAEYLNGTVTASNSAKWICEIDVKLTSASVTGVSLDQSVITLAPGESEQLAASVTPSYASNPGVSWSSDNPAVATVDASGLVTAVAGGNATITVTTTDGSFTATCSVTVEAEDPGTLTPPALTADTTDNSVGQSVDISFTDDADWRAAISEVTVNSAALGPEQRTISAGNINIAAGVFTAADDYNIVVAANGYADAAVTQTINEAAPGYTVTVDGDITSGSVGVNPAGGAAGETVTVTVAPDSGKQLVAGSLKYTADNGETYTEITATEGVYSFVLPAADVTVTAQFEDGIYTMWSGDGTQANPYQIKTAADLAALAEYTNTGNTTRGVYWELENDIDLSSVCSAALGSWTPIGNKQISTADVVTGYAFLGDLNGNGHSIQNLYVISESGYLGLFGAIGGNDNHDGTDGYGVVRNFSLYGSVTNTHDDWQEFTFPDYVGGVCGVLYAGGTISDVVNYATVQAPCVYNVGGIAGFAGTSVDIGTSMSYARYTDNPSGSNTSILRCVNHGAVGGYNKVGGMAGENASMIKFCYNTGRIDGANASTKNGVGGIVGRNGNNNTACEVGTIDSCYNAGTVGRSAQKWVGGIAGFQNAKSPVSNCYNIGTIIDGAGYNNPIIGQVEGPSINNYSLNTTFASGTSIEETGVRLSEAQFKDTAYTDTSILPLLGHYFVADTQNLNNGYPVLYWQAGVTLQPLTSIVVSTPPTKTVYNVTEVFNPAGMKVKAFYGTEIFEMVNNYTYPTDPLTAGTTSVTISYNGMEASQPITVNTNVLTSINIATAPTQTYYVAGDSFNKNGMVVNAAYNETLVETLDPADYTVTPAMLTMDTTEVTVSYTYGDATKTATQPITVMAALPELIDNYYQLEDVTDLLWFADNVTIMGNADINAKLLNDLDLTGIDWVTTIGTMTVPFAGTFDGNNKSITGLVKDNPESNYAIFGGATGATIKNLTVSVNLTNTGAFTAGLISTAKNCTVDNITVNGSITKTRNSYTAGIASSSKDSSYTNCVNNASLIINITAGQNAGGIVGYASGTDVLTNCVNNGVITTIARLAGGIVGTVTNTASIINCHNTAAINGTAITGPPPGGAYNIGGIAGVDSSTGTIARCSNTGAVSATFTSTNAAYALGGIVGGMTAAGTIDQCYNRGVITNSLLNSGGVVGMVSNAGAVVKNSYNLANVSSTSDHANVRIGGVVGNMSQASATISNCYNIGNISVSGTASNNYAGVIGYAAGIANVSNNYYLDTAVDKAIGFNTTYTEANAVSKTSAELQALATALGQYFKPGSLYPILNWQTEDAETFTVTVDDNISGGTVTVDPASGIAGDIVTVTVAPAEGKQLVSGSLKYTADSGETYTEITASEGIYSFVLPTADVTVTAQFEDIAAASYDITKAPVPDPIWTVTVDKTAATTGETVTITVADTAFTSWATGLLVTGDSGTQYDFTTITAATGNANNVNGAGVYSFVMPGEPVTVGFTADYTPLDVYIQYGTAGEEIPVHSYTRAEMEALATTNTTPIHYAMYDRLPAVFMGKAVRYVTIDQLAVSAATYNSAVHFDGPDCSLRGASLDGWTLGVNGLSWEYLMGQTRKYYAGIGDQYLAPENRTGQDREVPAVLAITGWAGRRTQVDNQPYDTLNTYRFFYGQTEAEYGNGVLPTMDERDARCTAMNTSKLVNKVVFVVSEDTPATYTVTADSAITGGSLVLSPTGGIAGDTITVTVNPDAGKQLVAGSLKYTADNGISYTEITATDGVYSFTLPAADTIVTARFMDPGAVVTGISLNKNTTTITVGNFEQLTATVTPADAANQEVTWTSDNAAAATVGSDGLVRAVGTGTANITVTTVDGGFTAACAVTVQAAGADHFTLAVLPDTQFYSESYPEIFAQQTQWIADQAQSQNIVFVAHVGDIQDDYDNPAQWQNARDAMAAIRTAGIPYSVVPGNHDLNFETGDTTMFDTYFPYTDFTGCNWYGGHYPESSNASSYQLFSAMGQDFIVLNLVCAPALLADTTDWANGVLTQYGDRKAIIVTHGYIKPNGEYAGGDDVSGPAIHENIVKKHSNVIAVLCGHISGQYHGTDTGESGNTVYNLLTDYTDLPNGGNGWLRLYQFYPLQNKIQAVTYSPYLDQYDTGADGQFELSLQFSNPPEEQTPPVLNADTTDNSVGRAVEITFTDDAAWRSAISGITVNGSALTGGQYTVNAGAISIGAAVFASAGDYTVTVTVGGYSDAAVTQTIEAAADNPKYTVTPAADDSVYEVGETGGIKIMTVKTGVSGLKYFGAQLTPVIAHAGKEAVVFTHLRGGVQLSLNVTRADFDLVGQAQSGFNVQAGDMVKVFIVDDLTNDVNHNPILLQ